MRILLFVGTGEFWADTLPAGLESIGCEVVRMYADIAGTGREALPDLLNDLRPDFILSMGWSWSHTPEWLSALRKACEQTGTAHVYWAIEDIAHHWRWSLPYVEAARPSLVLTINENCTNSYRRIGIPAYFCPFGCNPVLFLPVPSIPGFNCDVALIANYYEHPWPTFRTQSLVDLLFPLSDLGCQVNIWGSGWAKAAAQLDVSIPGEWLKGGVSYQRTAQIYSSAKIVLAPQNEALEPQLTQRTLEILASGACMLTSATEGIRRSFRPGNHLLATTSPLQTRALLEHHLEHADRRLEIAAAGREEVLRMHTYSERAEQVIKWVRDHLNGRKPIVHSAGPDRPLTESRRAEGVLACEAEELTCRVLVIEEDPFWHLALPSGLKAIGCEVRFDTQVDESELASTIADFKPNFVLMMGWTQTHVPARRKTIRRLLDRYQVPLVYWAVEDAEWFDHWSLPLVRDLRPNLVATIDAGCVSRYEAEGFQAAYLPFGCNPLLQRKAKPRPEYDCDVALVANHYQILTECRRQSLDYLLRPLLGQGYNVKVWGKRWDRAGEAGLTLPAGVWQGVLPTTDCAAVYASAKIVLGLQNGNSPSQLTMRTFDVIGSQAFLLSYNTPAVPIFFEPGKHLVTSDSPEETERLVDFYLAKPELRAGIAEVGQAEVYAKHTYADRARALLALLRSAGCI